MITNPSMMSALKDASQNGVFNTVGSGAPTNGTSGTGVNICGPGSFYYDYTNKLGYVNIGTLLSPYWQMVDVASAGNGENYTLRQRVSTANVNAGLTLLAAIPGWKYRVTDMAMIAIGGAAGATTTVDILATQAAGSVKLLAVAIAALTQSAVVRAGAANATVLADGASFVANDVNTAISINKTGISMTTATNIDVIINYQLEQ